MSFKPSVSTVLYAVPFGLVGLIPLALLAWKNARAIPVGLFAYCAFLLVSPLMWIVYLQSSGRYLAQMLVVLLVALALTYFSFRFAAATTGPRALWSFASFASWIWASFFVPNAYEMIESSARMQKSIAEVRAEDAEIARKTADLTTNPAKRAPVLDSTMDWYLKQTGRTLFLGQVRYLRFGDPATDPGSVSVWAVVSLKPPNAPLPQFNYNLKQLFQELNFWLKKAGYSWPVAAGAVEERDVQAAGGDSAFFGAAGERVVPQWPADKLQEAIQSSVLPPIKPAERRASP